MFGQRLENMDPPSTVSNGVMRRPLHSLPAGYRPPSPPTASQMTPDFGSQQMRPPLPSVAPIAIAGQRLPLQPRPQPPKRTGLMPRPVLRIKVQDDRQKESFNQSVRIPLTPGAGPTKWPKDGIVMPEMNLDKKRTENFGNRYVCLRDAPVTLEPILTPFPLNSGDLYSDERCSVFYPSSGADQLHDLIQEMQTSGRRQRRGGDNW